MPGGRHPGRMVKVIVPARVQAVSPFLHAAQHVALLVLVFGDHQRRASGRRVAHPTRERRQNVVVRIVDDRVYGVQPQTIHVELVDPIAGVADNELAHRAAIGPVVVDCVAPIGAVRRHVIVGVHAQIVSAGTEVVVDHVQHHAQSFTVGRIDKAPEIIGPAVQPRGRIQIDAVVAPAELAGKLRHRHDLDHRNAQLLEPWQFAGRRAPGAFGRERTQVQLVDHLPVQLGAGPMLIAPHELRRIDHLRRAVNSLGLKTRRRVGIDGRVVVDQKPVARAGRCLRRKPGKIAVARSLEFERLVELVGRGAEGYLYSLPPRGPNAKTNASAGNHLGADRQATLRHGNTQVILRKVLQLDRGHPQRVRHSAQRVASVPAMGRFFCRPGGTFCPCILMELRYSDNLVVRQRNRIVVGGRHARPAFLTGSACGPTERAGTIGAAGTADTKKAATSCVLGQSRTAAVV